MWFLLFLMLRNACADSSEFVFPENCSVQMIDYQLDSVGQCIEDSEVCSQMTSTAQTPVASTEEEEDLQECWYTTSGPTTTTTFLTSTEITTGSSSSSYATTSIVVNTTLEEESSSVGNFTSTEIEWFAENTTEGMQTSTLMDTSSTVGESTEGSSSGTISQSRSSMISTQPTSTVSTKVAEISTVSTKNAEISTVTTKGAEISTVTKSTTIQPVSQSTASSTETTTERVSTAQPTTDAVGTISSDPSTKMSTEGKGISSKGTTRGVAKTTTSEGWDSTTREDTTSTSIRETTDFEETSIVSDTTTSAVLEATSTKMNTGFGGTTSSERIIPNVTTTTRIDPILTSTEGRKKWSSDTALPTSTIKVVSTETTWGTTEGSEGVTTSLRDQETDTTSEYTTTSDNCSIECPDGYVVGSYYCFLFVSSSEISSYQTALSYCRVTDRQDMISYEHLRDPSDLNILTQSSISNEMSWFFANGGGSKTERFEKTANVFDIYDVNLASSPIADVVDLSEETYNVSAICVLPKYCNSPRCLVETSLEVLNVDYKMNATSAVIESKESTTVVCSYTGVETTISCGTRGSLIPHPSMITCEAESDEQVVDDDTGSLVESCSECYSRGTSVCYLTTIDNTTGYICSCNDGYSMSTCWYTENSCDSVSCGNGTCSVSGDETYCECDWGYEGDSCETSKNPEEKYAGESQDFFSRLINSVDSSTVASVQLTTWSALSMATRVVGKVVLANDEDDPQETHQSLREVFLTMGTTGVLLFNNPYLFSLPTTTCRMYFLIIHFLFVAALTQWLLEGFNANQVLRCRHLNRWEIAFDGKPNFGIKAVPRLIPSILLVAACLLTIYQSGWYQLVGTWTCTGVICESTSSMWLPIGFTIICLLLMAATIFENSVRVLFRRPLFDHLIQMRIDMNEGVIDGQNIEKCRRNPVLCFIGIILLASSWWLIILTADKRENQLIGISAILMASLYGIFSFIQGIVTCPGKFASFVRFLMSKLPSRIAPTYEPMGMWTRNEVLQVTKKDEYITKNATRFLQFKWDCQLNSKIIQGISMENAVTEILRQQLDQVDQKMGTQYQRQQILVAFAEWLQFANPNAEPLAAIEQVSICGNDFEDVVRTSMFYIDPHFGVFKPVINEEDGEDVRRENRKITKRNYQVIRDEVESQANFISSAIHFRHFGKITE